MYLDFLSAFLSEVRFLQPAREDFYFENITHAWASHWQPFCRSRLPETSLHLHRQQNRNQRNPVRASSRFCRLSHSHPARRGLLCGSISSSRRRFGGLIAGVWGDFTEREKWEEGQVPHHHHFHSLHHLQTYHHHQRDEACLRSLETHRNIKPAAAAAAAAPNKMNRVDRTPSPDAVWCCTFYYLFIFLIWNFLDFVGRAIEHCGLASNWMNDADFTSTLI